MAEAEPERLKLVELAIQMVAALGGLSALCNLILHLLERRLPKLELRFFDPRGELSRWGDPNKGDLTYFYHIRVKNKRKRPAQDVALILTKANKARAEEIPPDDELPSPVRLRWARKERAPDPTLCDIMDFNESTCNFGHIIQPKGFFQLNAFIEPLPDTFIVHKGERMRVEVVAENVRSNILRLEITWDGTWCDKREEMQKHLVVKEWYPSSSEP